MSYKENITIGDYNELLKKYNILKEENVLYKNLVKSNITKFEEKNMALMKKIDDITNILQISSYINSNIGQENFIHMVNDIMIGILGATFSYIFLIENGELNLKDSNNPHDYYGRIELINIYGKEKPFILNCKKDIFEESKANNIHSIIGTSIELHEKIIGYILIEHKMFDYFNYGNIKFVKAIASQIAIALENYVLYNKVKETAIKDPLLNIYNRRHFYNTVSKRMKNHSANNFAIVMIDVDDFKKFNDKYGHQFGDEVLKNVARIISSNVNNEDIVARYGGEEIIVYVENYKDKFSVVTKFDNIREKINKNIIICNGFQDKVTASFGIGYSSIDKKELNEVINLADTMLYKAKKAGKNKVITV